jgi:hypothetical protein
MLMVCILQNIISVTKSLHDDPDFEINFLEFCVTLSDDLCSLALQM